MPTNLELKAKVSNLADAGRIARTIGAKKHSVLIQTDTYFNVPNGRLKLREINARKFELIYYFRANKSGDRYSDYTIVPLSEPRILKRILTKLFGQKVVVRKRRLLYRFNNARIHLDRVKGLGFFIEFEILVTKGKAQAESFMLTLRKEFSISPAQVVAGSYSDLLFQKRKRGKRAK